MISGVADLKLRLKCGVCGFSRPRWRLKPPTPLYTDQPRKSVDLRVSFVYASM
jgi:hypothetical protein